MALTSSAPGSPPSNIEFISNLQGNQYGSLQSMLNFAINEYLPGDESYGFGGFAFHVVNRESFKKKSSISEHPIPTGENIGSYITTSPDEFTIEGFVSDIFIRASKNDVIADQLSRNVAGINSFVNDDALKGTSQMITRINSEINDKIGYLDGILSQAKTIASSTGDIIKGTHFFKNNTHYFFQILKAAANQKVIFEKVVAFGSIFKNMTLTDINISHKPDSEKGVYYISATFREVIEAQNLYSTKQKLSAKLKRQSSETVHKGISAKQPETLKSGAKKLLDNFGL